MTPKARRVFEGFKRRYSRAFCRKTHNQSWRVHKHTFVCMRIITIKKLERSFAIPKKDRTTNTIGGNKICRFPKV